MNVIPNMPLALVAKGWVETLPKGAMECELMIRTTDFDLQELQVVFFLKKQINPIYDINIETP